MQATGRDPGYMTEVRTNTRVFIPYFRADLAPCSQVQDEPPESHVQALCAAFKPGLEQVSCAGVCGNLALVRSTRALARSTMDEYFLYPAGATVTSARAG